MRASLRRGTAKRPGASARDTSGPPLTPTPSRSPMSAAIIPRHISISLPYALASQPSSPQGPNPAGYLFQGGTFNLAVPSGSAVAVALYSDSSNSPGSSLVSTTGTPDNNRAMADEFLVSTPFPLDASTKYWLVAHATDRTPQPSIGTASSTTADSGALAGWSIGASKLLTGGGWTTTGGNSAFAVGVLARCPHRGHGRGGNVQAA